MTHRLSKAAILIMLLCGARAVAAQSSVPIPPPNTDSGQMGSVLPDKITSDDPDFSTQTRRLRVLNAARQKSMVADATKLLALARTLNTGVAENGVALTIGQRLHMAAEIEKLARNVKEKMSYAAGTPAAGNLFRSWQ